MRCHYHAEEEAIGACAMCGHPLCENCTRERDRVFYCDSCLAEKDGASAKKAAAGNIPSIELPNSEYYRPPHQEPAAETPGAGKRPATAALLSIFIPFTGQIYNNQFAKALTFLLLFISCIILAQKSHPMEGLFGVIAAFIYFYQIYDAYKTARGSQEAEGSTALVPMLTGTTSDDVPPQPGPAEESHATAPVTESPIWGISLILIGFVFLLHNFNLIGLQTMGRLWPLFVIVTGLVMILTWFRRSTG